MSKAETVNYEKSNNMCSEYKQMFAIVVLVLVFSRLFLSYFSMCCLGRIICFRMIKIRWFLSARFSVFGYFLFDNTHCVIWMPFEGGGSFRA